MFNPSQGEFTLRLETWIFLGGQDAPHDSKKPRRSSPICSAMAWQTCSGDKTDYITRDRSLKPEAFRKNDLCWKQPSGYLTRKTIEAGCKSSFMQVKTFWPDQKEEAPNQGKSHGFPQGIHFFSKWLGDADRRKVTTFRKMGEDTVDYFGTSDWEEKPKESTSPKWVFREITSH